MLFLYLCAIYIEKYIESVWLIIENKNLVFGSLESDALAHTYFIHMYNKFNFIMNLVLFWFGLFDISIEILFE